MNKFGYPENNCYHIAYHPSEYYTLQQYLSRNGTYNYTGKDCIKCNNPEAPDNWFMMNLYFQKHFLIFYESKYFHPDLCRISYNKYHNIWYDDLALWEFSNI